MRTSREAVRVMALMCLGCALLPAAAGARPVDGARITNADAEPGNWLSYGRTYSEQRFSPLARINDDNAARLGRSEEHTSELQSQ